MVEIRRCTLPVDDVVPAVSAAVHEPPRRRGAPVLLTHGAGGDLDADGLVALAEVLAALGHPVVRANLPYREAGRRAAPRADRSVEPLRRIQAAAAAALGTGAAGWVLGGKSYGGRVASLAVADGLPARGLLFYGYPLHLPGKPERLRVDHWPQVGVPCLFLQGDRDPHCDVALLEDNLRRLARRPTVHVVPGGDHSLRITRAASPEGVASGPAATIATLSPVLAGWLRSLED